LDEMIDKKNNEETFFVLMFDAKNEYIRKTKFLEAYNKALKEKDEKAFYINIHNLSNENNKKLNSIRETYNNQNTGHSPFEDGGMAVIHNGKISSPFAYYGKTWLLNTTIGDKGSKNESFLSDKIYKDIEKGIQYNLDYVQDNEINM